MAYASAASPFAAVKGQNIFSGASSSSSKKLSVSPSPSPSPPLTNNTLAPSPFAGFASSQWSTSTATKRTGFEAFMGPTSPFATAGASPFPSRSKSPLRNAHGKSALRRSRSPPRRAPFNMSSAFSPYANGGMQSFFAPPHPKRARAESPNGGSSRSSLERTSGTGMNVFGSTWNESGDGSGEEDDEDEDEDEDERENRRPPSTFGERLRAGRDDQEDELEDEKEKDKDKLQEQEGARFQCLHVSTSLNIWQL